MISSTHDDGSDTADVAPDGRATRWAGHRTSRRAELVRGARRAVHHRGPDVSMDEIATEIGTSKSILYRYFTDKTGLQTAVGHEVLGRMREALEQAAASAGGPRERISAMVSVYLEMVDSSPHVYTFVTRPEAAATAGELRGFAAEIGDLVVDSLLPALRGDGPAGADEAAEVDPETLAVANLWAAGVVGLVRGAAERWMGDRVDDGAPVTGGAPETSEGPARAAVAAGSLDAHVSGMDRAELAAHLADWLWDGAVGVTRRARRRT
ncbi:TetR/AcrR family transcriptional regulator [Georgenia subflava]|uniref:TetR/AcrR family transcriptional regulator n=1 Tax=Georgenia subflava TaxID=1622177 RepID=UPI00186AE60E|nr:TetR/AcrR family transcriptional regulator [Georgenia subflava]